MQPLFWPLLLPAAAPELLAHRVLWASLTCLVVIGLVGRGWRLVRLAREPRRVLRLGAAGACLGVAWGVYIYAVNSGQVVQSSLGLFMIPLSTVLVGVLVFRERMKAGQWAGLGVAVVATIALTLAFGAVPWIALALCCLMAVYAALKKVAAAPVLEGFAVECTMLAPVAVAYLGWLGWSGEAIVGTAAPTLLVLAVVSGVLTTIPLLLHAAAIQRLPLVVVGVAQYLNPVLQFVLAVVVLNEPMPAGRWWGFVLVWVALAIFTVGSLSRRARPRAGVPAVDEVP